MKCLTTETRRNFKESIWYAVSCLTLWKMILNVCMYVYFQACIPLDARYVCPYKGNRNTHFSFLFFFRFLYWYKIVHMFPPFLSESMNVPCPVNIATVSVHSFITLVLLCLEGLFTLAFLHLLWLLHCFCLYFSRIPWANLLHQGIVLFYFIFVILPHSSLAYKYSGWLFFLAPTYLPVNFIVPFYLFIFLSSWIVVQTCHVFFIHSSNEEHLGCL